MKGFDRPLKPRWIYEFVNIVEVGDIISDYNDRLYDDILWELDGDVGKRKVRTVLSRYFLKSQNNPRGRKVEDLDIIKYIKNFNLEEIKPIMLFNIISKSKMLREISELIYEVYGTNSKINYQFLRKKIIEKYGERDISPRSLRNFLYTLKNFDVLKKEEKIYKWDKKLKCDDLNFCYMLNLYSKEYLGSRQIVLNEIEEHLFMFFKHPDFTKIAKKYNNRLWNYTRKFNKKKLMIYRDVKWNPESLNNMVKK